LPSFPAGETPKVFQTNYHQDFPRVLNGYVASVNVFFAIEVEHARGVAHASAVYISAAAKDMSDAYQPHP